MKKVLINLKYPLLTLIILAFSFLFAPNASASIIFSDDFNDNDFSDWTVQRNMQWSQPSLKCKDGANDAYWNIDNGKLGIKINSPGCVTEITPNNWSGSLENYTIDLDMSFVSGTDKNLAFRYASPNQWYDLKFDSAQNTVSYQQIPQTGDIQTTSFQIPNGSTYHIKVVVGIGKITTFIDGNQVIENIYDSSSEFSPTGKLALQASVGLDATSEVYFDNIVVTGIDGPTPTPTASPTPTIVPTIPPTATPTPTPTISPTPIVTPAPTATPTSTATPPVFPAFYQIDPLWKSTQYDSAANWNPLDPSFGRWGCAVTSAAMILKYYGITSLPNGLGTTPGNLNTWLQNTEGGYINEGLLNWQMVSKATAIMHITNPFWRKLEYSWGNGSTSALQAELTSGRPTILQVQPGHFVTAYQMGSFGKVDIIDPFYPKTTLADYGGTFVSMRKFQPSFTDLSHITIYMSQNDSVTLEKKSGNKYFTASASNFIEELWGQPGNQPSGVPTKIVDMAKPDDGLFRFKISRSKYALSRFTLFTTSKEGEVKMDSGKILVGPDARYIEFTYQKQYTNSATVVRKVDFDILDQDYAVARSVGGVKKKYDCKDITVLLHMSEALYKKNRVGSKLSFELFAKLFAKQKLLFEPEIYTLIEQDIKLARNQLF